MRSFKLVPVAKLEANLKLCGGVLFFYFETSEKLSFLNKLFLFYNCLWIISTLYKENSLQVYLYFAKLIAYNVNNKDFLCVHTRRFIPKTLVGWGNKAFSIFSYFYLTFILPLLSFESQYRLGFLSIQQNSIMNDYLYSIRFDKFRGEPKSYPFPD